MANDAETPFLAPEPAAERAPAARVLKGLAVGVLALGGCALGGQWVAPTTEAVARNSINAVASLPKVHIQIYGMAGCPFTRGFVEGPVVEVMDTVSELVDLEFIPFGNSYYPTSACGGSAEGMPYASYNPGYDMEQRQCWDKRCGLGAAQPESDCFTGEMICQHGTTDGMVTSAWACAKKQSGGISSRYIPFFQCTASNFLAVTSEDKYREVITKCAKQTSFDAEDLLACAADYSTLNAQGRLTPAHSGVPYALLDGEVLADTGCVACGDGIINKVCALSRAKGGPKSAACEAVLR